MLAQNYNFAPKFAPKVGDFLPLLLYCIRNFFDKKLSNKLKFGAGITSYYPPVTTPLEHPPVTLSKDATLSASILLRSV